MDDIDQPLANLIGHNVMISTRCGCTKVVDMSPERLIRKLGKGATLRIAASRLRCRTCRQRPTVSLDRTWETSGSRDRRQDPVPLPEWARQMLGR
jgi:hypothetical protein